MKRKAKCIGAAMLSLAMVASVLPTDGFAKAESAGTYSFIQDYTLGYSGGVVVYRGGSTGTPVGNTDVPINKHASDNPFAPEVIQDWNEPNLKLTQPVQYTTSDGKVHNVESMLTNFNFIADPASIDNSDVDGKLYVYATTEAIEYKASGDNMSDNAYNNHSLTILSTEDMRSEERRVGKEC